MTFRNYQACPRHSCTIFPLDYGALNVNIFCSVWTLLVFLNGKSRTFPEIADHGKMAQKMNLYEYIALKIWIFYRVQWIKRRWVELRARVMSRAMETLHISTDQVSRIFVITASLSGGFLFLFHIWAAFISLWTRIPLVFMFCGFSSRNFE